MRQDATIDFTELETYISKEPLNPNYLTQKRDIIVRLTQPYTAVLIDAQSENIVVPSNFCIIRVNENKILPSYLLWLLNSNRTKKKIVANVIGTSFAGIKPTFFSDLDIKLFQLSEQQKIGQLYELATKEANLLKLISEEKQKLYKQIIDDTYKKARRGYVQ